MTYLEKPNLLFHNRGDGTFEEVGKQAGVGFSDYCSSAVAIDYDRDGRPDLYVLVYGPRDRGPNIQADNAPPNRLFRNNGDGTFTDVTKTSARGRHGLGPRRPVGGPGRRWLARHLHRQRLRQQHSAPQQRRRHVHQHRAAGRACSTRASGWESRSTTTTATEGSTCTSRTTRCRGTGSCATPAIRCPTSRTTSAVPSSGGVSRRCPAALRSSGRRKTAAAASNGRRTRPASGTPPGPGAASSSTPIWTAGRISSSSTAW